jgi:GH24 family phage-related lysozyme (muramidase)
MQMPQIFQLFRDILGRGLTSAEVRRIEAELEHLGLRPETQAAATDISASLPSTISAQGIALIKQFEGCARRRKDGRIEAYPDPGTGGDPWTIGWGATGKGLDGEGRITRGTIWTQGQCDARLERDLERYAADVARALGDAPRSQAQFDAMVSFHYNTGAIARATLTKRHKAGDFSGSAREFRRWNKAGGRIMKGLARRRAAEEKLYRA